MPHAAPIAAPRVPSGAALVRALAGPDVDAALEQALERLYSGGDLPLLLATVRALITGGMAGIASRLLRAAGGIVTARPDVAALLTETEALPPGETPLRALGDRYRANGSALAASRPHLADLLPAVPAIGDDLHLFVSRAGNAQIVRDDDSGRFGFVFPFGDHRGQARDLEFGAPGETTAFLLAGVPSPPLLERLIALRLDSGYRPPIDIVEPDPEVLALWLHLVEDPVIFEDERIGVYAGARALDDYEAYRTSRLWRADPTHVLNNPRPGWTPPSIDRAERRRIAARVDEARRALLRRQAGYYEDRTAASWARRFRDADPEASPLRILAFTSRFSTVIQYAMRDLQGAFERAGCRFETVAQSHDATAIVDVWTTLAEQPYDLLVVINHLRSEMSDRIHPNLPYACWIQDHAAALYRSEAGRSVGAMDLVLGGNPGLMTARYGYRRDRFLATSNLTDAVTYARDPVPADALEPHRCDIAYVGHGSRTAEALIDDYADRGGAAFGAFLGRGLEMIRARLAERGFVAHLDFLAIMLDAEAATDGLVLDPAARSERVLPIMMRLADRWIRHETLGWTAGWAARRGRSFRLYGRGWDSHETLGPYAAGEVENGFPLRCVHQAARINLQVNAYGSLHQRLLDAIASGGFVLTRYTPADFIRGPLVAVQRRIEAESIPDLPALLRRRDACPDLAADLDAIEALGGQHVAATPDPQRRREQVLFRKAGDAPAEVLSDAAMFEALRTLRYAPHRAAGDLPGFEEAVFRDEAELGAQLDRYMDDEPARRACAEAMYESVAAHDTYDVLVSRILDRFRSAAVAEDG